MADNCTGGQISSLQINNTDCSCVSIASITWNPAGTQFTITLNNGQSITSPVLTGATGPAPTISFRVSGTTLQYSINAGTSWVSIYDLSSILDGGAITNQFPSLSTLGTAFESLISNAAGTPRTPFSLPANTLKTNGDFIVIESMFSTSSWTSALQRVRQTFDGNALNTPLNLGFFAFNVDKIGISSRLTRVSNTEARCQLVAKFYTTSLGGSTVFQEYVQDILTIAGLDLAANAYDIDAQGDSVVIGDVTCNAFDIVYTPII